MRGKRLGSRGVAHLDVGEENLEHVGTGVTGVEEHELGLLQVVGGKTLLNLIMSSVKEMYIFGGMENYN